MPLFGLHSPRTFKARFSSDLNFTVDSNLAHKLNPDQNVITIPQSLSE